MLVPLSTAVEVSVAIPTLWTLTPGAKISTAVPKLENEALASLPSMAPTVIAVGADPGDVFKASCYWGVTSCMYEVFILGEWQLTFSFPAATTTVTPARVKAAIAELSAFDFAPPRDIFMTDFPGVAFWATAAVSQSVPDPKA
jgi:hypothetical protein